jgi:hypothetical protein
MIRSTRTVLAVLFAALAAACSGGGGNGMPSILVESEPNDTPAEADALVLSRPGRGSLAAAGDVDCYSIALNAGRYLRVELFATRLDQETWDAAANVPRLELIAPDGTTKLLEHDAIGSVSAGWGWGRHDLDFPLFKIPANGIYFLRVSQADDTLPGGPYAVRPSLVALGSAQEEFEPAGTTGANDTPNTSQDIQPGVVHGFHAQGDLDYYAITVDEPTVLRFEVTAYRDGVHDGDDGYYDPTLQLFDTNGSTPLLSEDDGFFFDPALAFEIQVPGTYFLEVGECCGVGDADYLLSFAATAANADAETEPNDTTATADPLAYGDIVSGSIDVGLVDHWAFQGAAGDMVRIQVFDAFNLQDAGDLVDIDVLAPDGTTVVPTGGYFGLQTATTILQEDGTHYIRVSPTLSATDYRLGLSRFKTADPESASNDTIGTADSLIQRVSGAIEAPGDVDVFRFEAPGSHLTFLAIYAGRAATGSDGAFEYSGHGSDLQPKITVTNGAGTVIASCTSDPVSVFTESVTDPLPSASIAFIPSSDGPFYAHVESAFGAGGPTHTYVLERR